MGREDKNFYLVLAKTIATKQMTASQCPGYNKKISFSLNFLLCIRGSRVKNLNQEKMNVASDIELSESLSTVYKQ